MLRRITLFGALLLFAGFALSYVVQNSSAEKRSINRSAVDLTASQAAIPAETPPELDIYGSRQPSTEGMRLVDDQETERGGCAQVDVELGKFTRAEIDAMENICADSSKSTQTPPNLERGIHEANILTIVLDVRWTTDAMAFDQ